MAGGSKLRNAWPDIRAREQPGFTTAATMTSASEKLRELGFESVYIYYYKRGSGVAPRLKPAAFARQYVMHSGLTLNHETPTFDRLSRPACPSAFRRRK